MHEGPGNARWTSTLCWAPIQKARVFQDLIIVVGEADRDRALQIVDALKLEGWNDISVLGEATGLARKLSAIGPDLVLIDLENPSRDA